MKKIKDANGTIVDKLYRSRNGSIVVNDKSGYERYMAAKERALNTNKRVQTLESELSDMKNLLTQILEKQGNSTNG